MRHLVYFILFLLLPGMNLVAQNHHSDTTITRNETIIIKRDDQKGNGQTKIEIRNGNVYVDGESVATFPDNGQQLHKTIIINGDGAVHDPVNFWGDDGAAPPHVMLGVRTKENNEKDGAVIEEVIAGSPADKAGLKAGDRIWSIDGHRIDNAETLVEEIGRHNPEDEVSISYNRGTKSMSTTAVLVNNSNDPFSQFFPFGSDRNDGLQNMPDFDLGDLGNLFNNGPRLGITAEDATGMQGVNVIAVKPGSPAETAGLKEGDVITGLDGDNVGSVDELQLKVMTMGNGERKSLTYKRNGKTESTYITIPRPVNRKEL